MVGLREIPVGDDGGGGSIAQAGRVASRDGAALLEHGHEFCESIHRAIAANGFVGFHYLYAFFLLYFNRNDLAPRGSRQIFRR